MNAKERDDIHIHADQLVEKHQDPFQLGTLVQLNVLQKDSPDAWQQLKQLRIEFCDRYIPAIYKALGNDIYKSFDIKFDSVTGLPYLDISWANFRPCAKDILKAAPWAAVTQPEQSGAAGLLATAARSNDMETAKLLLKYGANTNPKHYRPLHLALHHNYTQMAKLLIGKGAEVQSEYVVIARHRENEDMTRLLKKLLSKQESAPAATADGNTEPPKKWTGKKHSDGNKTDWKGRAIHKRRAAKDAGDPTPEL